MFPRSFGAVWSQLSRNVMKSSQHVMAVWDKLRVIWVLYIALNPAGWTSKLKPSCQSPWFRGLSLSSPPNKKSNTEIANHPKMQSIYEHRSTTPVFLFKSQLYRFPFIKLFVFQRYLDTFVNFGRFFSLKHFRQEVISGNQGVAEGVFTARRGGREIGWRSTENYDSFRLGRYVYMYTVYIYI